MVKQKARTEPASALHERLDSIEALVPELRSYALSLTQDPVRADQLVEHCTVQAVERLSGGPEKSDLRDWLFTTLRHAHRAQTRQDNDGRLHHPFEANAPFSETGISQSDLNRFSHAFARLSPDEQDLLIRVAVNGASYEDAANAFGVSAEDVRTRVAQVRRKLTDRVCRDVR